MSMNAVGRQTRPQPTGKNAGEVATHSGHRGLDHEEALIFERRGSLTKTGVDLPEPKVVRSRLGGLERAGPIGLPGLSEPETMRHYVRLSRKNYAIDAGLYPLGSCTMKHNPRLNEKMARLPGLSDIHPLQPQQTVKGAIALMQTLSGYLLELTGMTAVALSPKAGAHGELCGMLAIKAALAAKGEIQGLTEDDAMSPEDRLKIEDRHYGEPANRCCCVAYLRACTLSVILGILLLLWDTGVIRVGLASVVAAASALAAWYMHGEAMTP